MLRFSVMNNFERREFFMWVEVIEEILVEFLEFLDYDVFFFDRE